LPGTEWDDKEKKYFAGKIKKPKNDQFAGDFEKNSLVAGLLPFKSESEVTRLFMRRRPS
jgi:hypothetical protein